MKTFLCEALPCVNDALGMNEDGAISTWLLLGFFFSSETRRHWMGLEETLLGFVLLFSFLAWG